MIEFLSAWYNWVFIVPFLAAVMMTLVETFFGGVSEMLGTGIDFDVDLDIDIDHDIEFDIAGNHFGFLTWLGVGKVPITILIELMGISFGGSGLLFNSIIKTFFPGFVLWLTFPATVIVSGALAIFITKKFGVFMMKLMPTDASTSKDPSDFLGESGIALTSLGESVGQVRIDDSTVLSARRSPKLKKNIEREAQILVVGYDSEKHTYIVEPVHLQDEKPYGI